MSAPRKPATARKGRTVTLEVRETAPGVYHASVTRGSGTLGKFIARVIQEGVAAISGRPESPAWTPLEPITVDPASVAGQAHQGTVEHFANDLYIVEREQLPSGVAWLSIKRIDKTRVREWRHLQQIKNELAGPEREGVEIFPPESNLVDQADQYHLWVLPEGATFGLGFNEGRIVMPPQDAARFAKQHGVPPVDQSAWQPGFTTGR